MDIPAKIQFCSITELHQKKIITKWVDSWRDEISAISNNGDIAVFSTICPHFGGEIELLQGPPRLRCKWHGWRYDLETGECLSSMMTACLRKYSFQKNNDYLELTLP